MGDDIDVGTAATTGFAVVEGGATAGLKTDGGPVIAGLGGVVGSVGELVARLAINDGAQDGCVLFASKQRHVGIVRPLLSTLLYTHSPRPKHPSGHVNSAGQIVAKRGQMNVAPSDRSPGTNNNCPSYSQSCSVPIRTTRSVISHVTDIQAGR